MRNESFSSLKVKLDVICRVTGHLSAQADSVLAEANLHGPNGVGSSSTDFANAEPFHCLLVQEPLMQTCG